MAAQTSASQCTPPVSPGKTAVFSAVLLGLYRPSAVFYFPRGHQKQPASREKQGWSFIRDQTGRSDIQDSGTRLDFIFQLVIPACKQVRCHLDAAGKEAVWFFAHYCIDASVRPPVRTCCSLMAAD